MLRLVDTCACANRWRAHSEAVALFCCGLMLCALLVPPWPGATLVLLTAMIAATAGARVPARAYGRALLLPGDGKRTAPRDDSGRPPGGERDLTPDLGHAQSRSGLKEARRSGRGEEDVLRGVPPGRGGAVPVDAGSDGGVHRR